MTHSLPPDATVADVMATLDKPEVYVPAIYGVMNSLQRQLGGFVEVRIGVRGKGIMPNYRIDYAGKPIEAFDGQTHKPFTDVGNIDTENWSIRSMTFGEIGALLSLVREQQAQFRRIHR